MRKFIVIMIGAAVLGMPVKAAAAEPLLLADFDDVSPGTWYLEDVASAERDDSLWQLPTVEGWSLNLSWDISGEPEWAGGGIAGLDVDATNYSELSFWIYTGTPGLDIKVAIRSEEVEPQEAKVNLIDYLTTVPDTWQQVSIPISAFLRVNKEVDLENLNVVSWISDPGDTEVVYMNIDNVRLTSQPRTPAYSLIYSGGLLGGGDLPGDTSIWWDQAASTETTDVIEVQVDPVYAVSWETTPEVIYENIPDTTNWFVLEVLNEGNTADRIELSTSVVKGESWPASIYWDVDGSGEFNEGDPELWDSIGTIPGTPHKFLVRVEIPSGAVIDSSMTLRVTAKSSGDNDGWEGKEDTVSYDFTIVAGEPPESLLANPSFEEQGTDPDETWNPLYWGVEGTASREEWESRTGNWSLMIKTDGEDPGSGYAYQSTSAAPGYEYTLSVWALREAGDPEDDVPLYIELEWLYGDEEVIDSVRKDFDPPVRASEGGPGWAEFTLSSAAPAGTEYIRVKLGGENVDTGGFFDDVVLQETPVIEELLVNRSFEEGSGQGNELSQAYISGWTHDGAAGYWVEGGGGDPDAYDGDYMIKRYAAGTYMYQDFGAVEGSTYSLSVWAYDDSTEALGAGSRLELKVEWYDSGDVQLSSVIIDTLSGGEVTDAWYELSGEAEAPADTEYGRIVITTEDDGDWSGSVYYDLASVEGQKPVLPVFPAVSIVKSADRVSARPGDEIIYTITYGNTGAEASNVVIVDAVPFNTVLVDSVGSEGGVTVEYYYGGQWEPDYDSAAEKIRWNVGSLGYNVTDQEAVFTVEVR